MSKKSKSAPPSTNSKAVYINPKQQQFLSAPQRRKTFLGGRGSGKSTTKGFKDYQRFWQLPRAKGLLAGLTYNQILTKTIPAAEQAWKSCGFKEYDKDKKAGHYCIGVKPPHFWIKPLAPPRNYDNTITFCNGYTIEMLSLDRPDSGRGGSYDFLDIDESALIKQEIYSTVLRPMVRGNIYEWDSPLHQEICDYTSAPWLPSGQWVFNTEELAKKQPNRYAFVESSAYDNVAILGKGYIEDLRDEMTKLQFAVEVENQRLKKLPNCFYPAWNEDKHLVSNTWSYGQNDAGIWVSQANFLDPDKPLDSSWDFNAAIVSTLICQERGREFRIDNALFTKESHLTKIDAQVDLIVSTYANHKCKLINLYGDRNGNNENPGLKKTFYESIIERFASNGWKAILIPKGLDSEHRVRHQIVNGLLSEENARRPVVRCNLERCKFLSISIQNSPMNPDWTKNKDSERVLLDQERATHLSDCLDNILVAKFQNLFSFSTLAPFQVYFLGGRR